VVRFAIIALLLIVFAFLISREIKNKNPRNLLAIALIGLLFGIIPSLPNSISAMYQGNVNANSFTSLPVSYFLYFSILSLCSVLIYKFGSFLKGKLLTPVLFIAFLFALPIQIMNSTFANVHESNFQRIQLIEQVMKTELVDSLDGDFEANDLYETKNALSIHNTFWTQYAEKNGLNISLDNNPTTLIDGAIYFPDSKFFMFQLEGEYTILSKNPIEGDSIEVELSDGVIVKKNVIVEGVDTDFLKYTLE
jgi:hypothetical protein